MQRFIDKNFTGGRQGNSPQFVVIHTYGGAGRSLFNWFNNSSSQVSAHYAIFKDGNNEQYVREGDTAWHAGNWEANLLSIGIEHQDDGNPNDAVRTNELYETSAQLIADIYRRYGWDINNQGLIKPHNEFVQKVCPGALDIGRIRNRVYEILHPAPAPIEDNLYRVKRGNQQLGAFKERDNAFNIWYDTKESQVILNNQNITSEFLNMANKLDEQIETLRAEKQEIARKLSKTSEDLETSESTILTQSKQIEALQLKIDTYKKYEVIEKVIQKIKIYLLRKNKMERFTSRKFLFAVGFFALVIANQVFKWGITVEELVTLAGVIGAFIGIEGAVDYKRVANQALDLTSVVESAVKLGQEIAVTKTDNTETVDNTQTVETTIVPEDKK